MNMHQTAAPAASAQLERQGLELRNVQKAYGSQKVIHGVDFTVTPGEFIVFVGPSGCGKSTLLRMIAGLEDITGGDVEINGVRVNDVDPSRRGVAMVFQNYALYPHMTVAQNMGFGLRMNGTPRAEVAGRVQKAAETLRIIELLDRKPKALSGGQRQRVAIGRAIVRAPHLFLFDEPLSNLDAELRVAMRVEIAKLHAKLNDATMIYVTHDQVEAMTLADRIVVLRDGRVEQVGTPMELYHDPDNVFVAGFIGSPKMNLLPVTVSSDGLAKIENGGTVRLELGAPACASSLKTLGIRPDALELANGRPAAVSGEIALIERLGDATYVHIEGGFDGTVIASVDPASNLQAGDTVDLALSNSVHLFDENDRAVRGIKPAV